MVCICGRIAQMADKRNQNPNTQEVNKPLQGGEGLIKNLTTSPESDGDRESLLDQIVENPQDGQSVQPAQDKQGGKDDTK